MIDIGSRVGYKSILYGMGNFGTVTHRDNNKVRVHWDNKFSPGDWIEIHELKRVD